MTRSPIFEAKAVRLAAGLCCTAASLVCAGVVRAQPDPSGTIQAVEFTGLTRVTESYVRELVRARAGDPFDPARLDEAVTRLLRTGRFLSVRYQIDEDAEGVRVTFELREHPVVTAVLFEGNEKFGDSRLGELVKQGLGVPIDWLAVRDGREAIIALYRDEGFGDAVVTYDQDRLNRTGELVYTIDEGRRVRIRSIVFEGVKAFSDAELKRKIETKKALWIVRVGAFDVARAEADAMRLQAFYRDQGFLDAQVGYRTEISEDGQDLTVLFTIDEGTRYKVETIEFRGLGVFTPEELLASIGSKVGQTVKRPQVDVDVRAIRTRFGEIGYIDAAIRASRVYSDTPGLVRLTFEINEGAQYRVGRVTVRGNARTKDKVVRRALNLYPPDDLFDLTEAREAERRLLETRLFSTARVYAAGDRPGVRDIVIDVEEAEKAGDFLFGVGVTSNSGLVGNIVLDLQNFDIADRPQSLSELIKFRSFFGAGQRLRLELQPGTDLNRFRIAFTEPYLFDKPLRFDVGGYLFGRGRDGYVERRGGTSVSLGRRFERGWLHGWSSELALRVESVAVRDVDLFASREIRKDEGSNLMTSVKVTFVRDRTDSRFVPTTGGRLRLGYEHYGVFGGDHEFGKVTAGYTWYKTVRTDEFDRKSVLQLRAEGGAIIGDAPVFSRFYAGGTGSIRGFDFRGVGPRDGIDGNNVGGDFLTLLGAEYSFPLIGENVRGLFFLDTGTVDSGAWRAAIGAGVQFTIDVFGPVPLELDLAVPFSTGPDDEEQIFSFQIGGIF